MDVIALIADFARRLAQAVSAAQQYTHHADTSRILQQGLLPTSLAAIPRMDTHVVYEPTGDGATAGGDFYDLFRTTDGRWCFALGDVCGHGAEAAVIVGLVRPLLKVLAEDGYSVSRILNRLNRVLVDDAMPIAEFASARHARQWDEIRPVSLLYGELMPDAHGTLRCALASAGHPVPLLLHTDGSVRPAAEPQLLLGVMEHTAYECQEFTFESGDTMLCVTDGVTERRCGKRQFDDDGGLSQTLSSCVGLGQPESRSR
ncbi:PP2C family protein-serine/threonine phosphatase [Streptomyces mirabilis]|uniref:PP2C family protein-serine/threonine phosphatase n=1 Tax=Streptomyces mirabilis TaxID=68239 RepID=UPI0036DD4DD1